MLRKQIQKINQGNLCRFHMPGHKGKKGDLHFYDITEISGADNLHAPEGIIEAVQKKLAKAYGSEEAAILVNGSTTGNQSAILGACLPGKKLLVPTNSHRSVFGALSLGRIEAVFIQPKWNTALGFAQEITPEKVEEALKKDKEISGMILTNPTYYGTTSKLKAIATILHHKNKFLIVDEAHGAHLHFHKDLPMDALEAGADVVIQSTHKVLGSLTQSSLMHFQGGLLDRERIKLFLAMLQSSSPSYPLLMSVEEAVDEALEKGAEIFGEIMNKHQEFCKDQNSPMTLYDGKELTNAYDTSKWLFHVSGISGQEAEEILAKEYGVHCELSGLNHVLAMTGIGTSSRDLEQLIKGVQGINAKIDSQGQKPEKELNFGITQADFLKTPRIKIPFWKGVYAPKTMLDVKVVKGKISGDFIIPYPPGIPLLFPGSLITKEIHESLQIFLKQGMSVVGITKEGKMSVFEEGEFHGRK